MTLLFALVAALGLGAGSAQGQSSRGLPKTVKAVKPSIVGIGTLYPTRQPQAQLLGSGFVVGDGQHVMANAHVYRAAVEDESERHGRPAEDFIVAFHREGDNVSYHHVVKVSEDAEHDIVLLKLTSETLPPLTLGDDAKVEEGQSMAFTGFPIGSILGLYPATHQAIVASITPIVQPMPSGRALDNATISRLRETYIVFQLDAIAYPGNSGSPLYDPETGEVYGIVNSVFVKTTKERILDEPSGIAYAIPIRYAKALLEAADVSAR